MIRLLVFKLLTVHKVSRGKTGYQRAISDSFPMGAAGLEPALPALYSHRIEPCGVLCVL